MVARTTLNRLIAAESAVSAYTPRLAQYAKRPAEYAREVLGIRHLTPAQIEVLQTAARPGRVRLLVPSANETGKSFIAAVLCSWHYDCYRPSLTITTAPAQAQVTQILFRELRRLRRGDPGFAPKAPWLSDGDDHICWGYTAKDATSFHGRHDASVMVIFDEAEGIESEFWEAAESFADKWVCFYNPISANSAAAVEERKPGWDTIRMSALDHPNVIRGAQGLTALIPNAVTYDKAEARLKKWAIALPEGEEANLGDVTLGGVNYRPGPIAEARVLGRRPTKPVNAVFAESDLEALWRPRHTEIPSRWAIQIGCDVARYGDDFTAIHIRQGRVSIHHETHNGWNTRQIARRLRDLCVEFHQRGEVEASLIPVIIDDTGVGGGVVDQNSQFRFLGMNASGKSDIEEEYLNLRSQITFDFEGIAKAGLADLSRLSAQTQHDITMQLRVMSYTFGPRGHRIVAPKKDIKLALGRSPDDADAMLLAYYQFPDALEVHR